MKFPRLRSPKRGTGSSERVFSEATELAQVRLQQCMADLHTRLAALDETENPSERTLAEEELASHLHDHRETV